MGSSRHAVVALQGMIIVSLHRVSLFAGVRDWRHTVGSTGNLRNS